MKRFKKQVRNKREIEVTPGFDLRFEAKKMEGRELYVLAK